VGHQKQVYHWVKVGHQTKPKPASIRLFLKDRMTVMTAVKAFQSVLVFCPACALVAFEESALDFLATEAAQQSSAGLVPTVLQMLDPNVPEVLREARSIDVEVS
jgi:hypothetical protein